ncbi:hypothetical protein AB0383_27200 [Amycolatopsis sp. NPDC051373]|uniref:YaaC family protein n=1 Tax=Amycolatopsis sp. NPDC051373 TaxID=3155801 RepID=UPI00344F30D6
MALGVDPLPPRDDIRIGDAWSLVPELVSVPISKQGKIRTLAYEDARIFPTDKEGTCRIMIANFDRDAARECGEDDTILRKFLQHYPTLSTVEVPDQVANSSRWTDNGRPGLRTELRWTKGDLPGDLREAASRLLATKYRGPSDLWVFPKLGAMTGPIHPLLTWWVILFALSIMTRYEPDHWSRMITIDQSPDANAIEHLLDQAIDVVPTLLLEALKVAST